MKRNRINREERIRRTLGSGLLIVGIILFISLFILFPKESINHDESYYLFFISSLAVFYCGLFLLIKNPYKRAFHYIKLSSNYIWFVFIFFIFSALLGFIFASNFGFLNEMLRQLISQTEGLNVFQLFDFIFMNNAKVSVVGLFSGVLFGIIPLFYIFINGIVLGYVFNLTWTLVGWQEFWRILPHGIFELPAVFISLALGIRIGTFVFVRGKIEVLKERLRESLFVFLFVVVPLLLIAGIIESLLIILSQ
jgi:stage II sporulation protein M